MEEVEKKPWLSLGTKIKLGVVIALIVLAVVVFFRNSEQVNVDLLFMTLSMPAAVLMIVTLLAGFLLGMVTSMLLHGRTVKKHPHGDDDA
jgi:uncharacterized integral membrane protein